MLRAVLDAFASHAIAVGAAALGGAAMSSAAATAANDADGASNDRSNVRIGAVTSADAMRSSFDASGDFFAPKYLTSSRLFHLQLADSTFRRHILLQILIFFAAILRPTVQKSSPAPSPAEIGVIAELSTKVHSMLTATPPNGASFDRIVRVHFERDLAWVGWKRNGCVWQLQAPADGGGSGARRRAFRAAAAEALWDSADLGHPELTRIWEIEADVDSSDDDGVDADDGMGVEEGDDNNATRKRRKVVASSADALGGGGAGGGDNVSGGGVAEWQSKFGARLRYGRAQRARPSFERRVADLRSDVQVRALRLAPALISYVTYILHLLFHLICFVCCCYFSLDSIMIYARTDFIRGNCCDLHRSCIHS